MTQSLGKCLLKSDPESLEPIGFQDREQVWVLTETQGEETHAGAQRADDEDRPRSRRTGFRTAGRAATAGRRPDQEIGRNGRLRAGRQTESHAGQTPPAA